MSEERKTLKEMIDKDEVATLTVFSHRNSSDTRNPADYFYTMVRYDPKENSLTIRTGEKSVTVNLWDHLNDVHEPRLSANDARVIMASLHRKDAYDAICPPEIGESPPSQ